MRWKGQTVTELRQAHQGDQGFDPSKGDQIIVKLQDGSERCVPRNETTQ